MMRETINQGRLVPPRPKLCELERAHHRCVAELMVLAPPRRVIGNADRFDVLKRADYLDDFLGAVAAYVNVMVADLAKEFPIGFTDEYTDILIGRMKDIVRALHQVVDRTIDGEAA
jgi:hypothetical protein